MSKNESESRLTFIRFDHFQTYTESNGWKRTVIYDLYQCSCGNQKVIRRTSVRGKGSNLTRSCGCFRREVGRKKMQKMRENGLVQSNLGNRNDVNKNGGISRSNVRTKTGKVRWYNPDGTWHMITKERADARFYGLEGELHSLQIADEWIQFDSKSVKPEYIPVVNLLKKGWTVRGIAKHLNMGESTLYRLSHIWRNGGQINWKPKTQKSKDRCKHTS